MINYYQPFLLPFLRRQKYQLPERIKQYYYHSFEDALWELFRQKQIPPGAALLLPDFYCVDVLNNIKNHGYQVKLYPLDKHFQIPEQEFLACVQHTQPAIIFIFHACGITNSLLNQKTLNQLPPNTIIIEDSVHRLINPEDINLLHPNHIVIDSLRKDSPLPGSFLYADKEFLNYPKPTYKLFSAYVFSSTFYFILFKLTLSVGFLLNSTKITTYAHTKVLQKHDDIIGDSWASYAGLPFIPRLHRHLNFAKIEATKKHQARLYQQLLFDQNTSSSLYQVTISPQDFAKLHVYPVGINSAPDQKLIAKFHKKNLAIWFKFPDCEWSKEKGVLFLPLGFHITDEMIEYTCKTIRQLRPLA